MISYVYEDANLTKQLKTLVKGGGNATAAALHARAIIDQLIDGGTCNPKLMGRLTRYGEARIRGCIKFDLVRGYRLIGVMRDHQILFLYVGSHGECDLWIRNNAGLEPILDKKRNRVFEISETDSGDARAEQESEEPEPEPDYDEQVLGGITDQELRVIFCGLCGK